MNTGTRMLAGAVALVVATALPLAAEEVDHSNHAGMDMSMPKGDQGASSKAFAEANARMHTDMARTAASASWPRRSSPPRKRRSR